MKLEQSPFYAASGGQVSDSGYLVVDGTETRLDVAEVLKFGDDQVLAIETKGAAARGGTRVRAVVEWSSASRRWRTTPPPTCSTRRSARCSATTSSRRGRPCGPTSSASTSAIPSR